MMQKRSLLIAWLATGIGLLLTAAIIAVGYRYNVYSYNGPITSWYQPLLDTLPNAIALPVGGLIAARRPENPYGWLWVCLGWTAGVIQPLGGLLAHLYLTADSPRVVLGGLAVYGSGVGWLLSLVTVAMAILLFPTGNLPSPRWRWLVYGLASALILTAGTMWAIPGPSGIAPVNNPFGLAGQPGQTAELITVVAISFVFAVVLPLAALSLLLRYRHADRLRRAQLRWLLFAAMALIVHTLVDSLEIHRPWISETAMTNVSSILLAALPVAVAVAVLRYRLYDIDVIIRKTLTYGLLSSLLALLYFGFVLVLQEAIGHNTGDRSPLIVVISTLVIAALFSPLRRQVQSFIDRRFYRGKYDAGRVLERFAQIARDEVSLETLRTDLAAVIYETVQPQRVSVVLVMKDDVRN